MKITLTGNKKAKTARLIYSILDILGEVGIPLDATHRRLERSAGPMSEIRVRKLKNQLAGCTATPVFVTAFLTRKEFRRWVADIAWETEVWLAESPEHMIHFNGYKFLEMHQ